MSRFTFALSYHSQPLRPPPHRPSVFLSPNSGPSPLLCGLPVPFVSGPLCTLSEHGSTPSVLQGATPILTGSQVTAASQLGVQTPNISSGFHSLVVRAASCSLTWAVCTVGLTLRSNTDRLGLGASAPLCILRQGGASTV